MSDNPPMRLPEEVPDEAWETLDPQTNPGALAMAQKVVGDANAGQSTDLGGDEPKIPRPDSDTLHVDLPVGLESAMLGKSIHTAEVRELNGEDEEYFLRGKNFWDRKSRIIERATVSLGDEPAEKSVLMSLAQGDREASLLAISRATYGDEVEMSLHCPKCGEDHDIAVDLTELEVREQDGISSEITLKSGKTIRFHWPTGEDQKKVSDFVSKNRTANEGEVNTQMLAQVVETIDGHPSFGEQTARKMGMRDRRELIRHISENVPGPIHDSSTFTCPVCGLEDKVEVTFEDMFR